MREVELTLGYTKSMGENSYEFLRHDVTYRDVLRDDETHDEVCDRIYEQLSTKLVDTVKALDEEIGYAARTSKIHAKGYKPEKK